MTTARSLSVIASSYLGASVAYDPRIWGERKVAKVCLPLLFLLSPANVVNADAD